MSFISKGHWQALRRGGSFVGLRLEEVMSLGTATTHQCSMSSTQKRDPSQAGSIPTPMGLCQRDRERRGGWKVKKGE